MNVCVVITVANVWRSYAVKGFGALWDNITTAAMVMLLKEVLIFYVNLRGNCIETRDCFYAALLDLSIKICL
jgi:hypothetical protein